MENRRKFGSRNYIDRRTQISVVAVQVTPISEESSGPCRSNFSLTWEISRRHCAVWCNLQPAAEPRGLFTILQMMARDAVRSSVSVVPRRTQIGFKWLIGSTTFGTAFESFHFIYRAFLEMLKAPIPNASDGTQSHSLFLGNLSMFINEDDIEVLFNQYSGGTPLVGNKKMEAKIIRTEKGMSLGYGFINMRSEAEAEAAMKALNGRQFHGRPLQINWAVRNIKKTAPSTEQDLAVINSVHVKFSTLNVSLIVAIHFTQPCCKNYHLILVSSFLQLQRGHLVTEETLHHHFARYGNVTDVFVKYSCFNKVCHTWFACNWLQFLASCAWKPSQPFHNS